MPIPGSSYSAIDLIKAALRSLNVLAAGEEPTGAEAQDSLFILNQMIDTFNGDGLMLFTEQIDDFLLNASQQTYTYGTGGNFNKPRPSYINRASCVMNISSPQPIEYELHMFTTQEWQQQVPVKTVAGNLPIAIYDDGSFPLRNITFWPLASDNVKFRSYTMQKLTQFADLQQTAAFPEGYLEAFRHNLAVRLAPEFQAPLNAATIGLATSTLAQIKSNNADDVQLRSDISPVVDSGRQMRAQLFGIA